MKLQIILLTAMVPGSALSQLLGTEQKQQQGNLRRRLNKADAKDHDKAHRLPENPWLDNQLGPPDAKDTDKMRLVPPWVLPPWRGAQFGHPEAERGSLQPLGTFRRGLNAYAGNDDMLIYPPLIPLRPLDGGAQFGSTEGGFAQQQKATFRRDLEKAYRYDSNEEVIVPRPRPGRPKVAYDGRAGRDSSQQQKATFRRGLEKAYDNGKKFRLMSGPVSHQDYEWEAWPWPTPSPKAFDPSEVPEEVSSRHRDLLLKVGYVRIFNGTPYTANIHVEATSCGLAGHFSDLGAGELTVPFLGHLCDFSGLCHA